MQSYGKKEAIEFSCRSNRKNGCILTRKLLTQKFKIMIAFLGTGLLGSNWVRSLRKRGEEVHVWNRTASKAKALEETGAKAFANPAEAVKGAKRIHIAISDDAAVNSVLD